jgi:hypothetical protein
LARTGGSFASRFAVADVSLRTAAELLEHKTLAIITRCAHLSYALRDAVKRVGGAPSTTTTDGSTVAKSTSTSVSELTHCAIIIFPTMRKWRNWQTRRT